MGSWGQLPDCSPVPQDTYHHHWREGNLPLGGRCEICRKTCGSSDVLAGVRCEWCGVQVGTQEGKGREISSGHTRWTGVVAIQVGIWGWDRALQPLWAPAYSCVP